MKKSIIDNLVEESCKVKLDYSKIKKDIQIDSPKFVYKKGALCSILGVLVVIISVVLAFSLRKEEPQIDNKSTTLLMKNVNSEYQNSILSNEYCEFYNKINSFELSLASDYLLTFGKGNNEIFSPGTTVNLLAMALEGASDSGRNETLNSIGLDYNTFYTNIPSYINQYKSYRNNGTDLQLSNSIWIDNRLEVKNDCLSTLANRYETSSFHIDFKDTKNAKLTIKDYISENTHGILKPEPQIDNSTLLMLMSVLYLKDIWNGFGNDLVTTGKYLFTNSDNTTTLLDYYSDGYNSGKVYNTTMYTACSVKLLNTKVTFFVPNDGYSLDDLINNKVIKEFNDINYVTHNNELKEKYFTKVHFPEFKVSGDQDISNILKEKYGITSIFAPNAFNRISDQNLCATGVKTIASIDLNKSGIEGAAVAYMPLEGTSCDDYTSVYEEFYINKPFLFNVSFVGGLINTQQGGSFVYNQSVINLFSGCVNKL